jgi:hypothetical protein
MAKKKFYSSPHNAAPASNSLNVNLFTLDAWTMPRCDQLILGGIDVSVDVEKEPLHTNRENVSTQRAEREAELLPRRFHARERMRVLSRRSRRSERGVARLPLCSDIGGVIMLGREDTGIFCRVSIRTNELTRPRQQHDGAKMCAACDIRGAGK